MPGLLILNNGINNYKFLVRVEWLPVTTRCKRLTDKCKIGIIIIVLYSSFHVHLDLVDRTQVTQLCIYISFTVGPHLSFSVEMLDDISQNLLSNYPKCEKFIDKAGTRGTIHIN